MENDRFYAVISKIADYIKSPSLRHIRDPRNFQKLAKEIIQSVDRAEARCGASGKDAGKRSQRLRHAVRYLPMIGQSVVADDGVLRFRLIGGEPM
jgi:hypothetical protein